MRLTRWEPFREMDDFFKGFAPIFGRMPVGRTGEGLDEFMPLADIVERDKEYLHHHRHITRCHVLIEIVVAQFDRVAVEQRRVAFRAARPVSQAPGRHADHAIAVLAYNALFVGHERSYAATSSKVTCGISARTRACSSVEISDLHGLKGRPWPAGSIHRG